MNKVIIVTGGTSGIGLAAVNELIEKGCTVYEISRREKGVNPKAVHISADITDREKISDSVRMIFEKEGRIDAVINNAGFGIEVCTILPGDIRTGFTGAREKDITGDDIYNGRISRSVATMEHDEENGMDPAKAGSFITRVALRKSVKPVYTIGLQYKFFVFLTRILPDSILNRIVGMIYAK